MNARQAAFYRQARSDWEVFSHLSRTGADRWGQLRRAWCRIAGVPLPPFPVCHALHYLQMCTEKLAKAYYPTDLSPRLGHASFRRFLTDFQINPKAPVPLGFADLAELTRWAGSVSPIVGAVEDLAPQIADRKNLPNPEYPWPRGAEVNAPADYPFTAEVFNHFDAQTRSGEPPFLTIFGRMIETMRAAGWHL